MTAGWGTEKIPKESPENLMKLQLSYLPSQKCQTRIKTVWHKSQLCTIPAKSTGFCFGKYMNVCMCMFLWGVVLLVLASVGCSNPMGAYPNPSG